jgi:hypothetical protein
MNHEDWIYMGEFYRLNRESVLGVGMRMGGGGVWYPLPQVAKPGNRTMETRGGF